MNYEVFLPMTRTMRVWKNRQKKWIDQVLFPNYIFVKTRQCELYHITQTPKVVTYIQCAGKPSIIPLNEVEGIKKILCLEQEISVETKFYEGDKVKIVCGPLVGHEGILIKQNGKTRFGIQLKEINHIVLIDIDTRVLEKI
jgi:transcription antitermination factor NusG